MASLLFLTIIIYALFSRINFRLLIAVIKKVKEGIIVEIVRFRFFGNHLALTGFKKGQLILLSHFEHLLMKIHT